MFSLSFDKMFHFSPRLKSPCITFPFISQQPWSDWRRRSTDPEAAWPSILFHQNRLIAAICARCSCRALLKNWVKSWVSLMCATKRQVLRLCTHLGSLHGTEALVRQYGATLVGPWCAQNTLRPPWHHTPRRRKGLKEIQKMLCTSSTTNYLSTKTWM